ncbi:MarR family winged helix-turn-helix transcriptional regulator [Sagittula stellata]|uniref:Transcriptional regulatory protein n=1 Tax=Sagittula stellata (strain ATCC 700073 / DSM 11524 / E-37) TaxID=388399 RepID=A3JYT7_SAGS3|nr:transcriptional regulatory protein [Sagittula stellata E-37]
MKVHAMPGHLIRRLNQISTQVFSRHMADAGYDLTPVQFAALDAIIDRPGIDQASVAAAIAYDRATIGGVIDRLEQKGLVRREVSRHDRRAREVRPTDDGRTLFEASLPVVTALQDEMLHRLTEAERETFIVLARKAIGPVGEPPATPARRT